MPGFAVPPPWFKTAERYLGTSELPKLEHNSLILKWLSAMKNIGKWGKSQDETPWCAAFVHACLEVEGFKGTAHGLAYSYVSWGKPAPAGTFGAIAVLRYKGHIDSYTGSRAGYHVGFLVRETKYQYRVLGGNQGNKVSYKNFPKTAYDLVALRLPLDYELPTAQS
jgi:uncharacterized protein (TIGR02594 family)